MAESKVRAPAPRQRLGAPAHEPLFDPVTSLPMLPLLLESIRTMLRYGHDLGVLTLSITYYSKFEEIYGWETLDSIVRCVADCLQSVKLECLRREDLLAELTISGNAFVLLLSPPRHRRALLHRHISRVRQRIQARLHQALRERMAPELAHRFGCLIGCGLMKYSPSVRLERLLYRTIEEALGDASSENKREVRQKGRCLAELIESGRLSSVFQPIVDLADHRILGYELLLRGPKGEFESPDVLFKVAYESDLVWILERCTRRQALASLKKLHPEHLLFVNVEPTSIFDPDLMRHELLRRHNRQIVFEITERSAIDDLRVFREAVQHLKKLGFRVSVDDLGSAYSGLRLIAAIEPDFIKLDMELTRGVHDSRVKTQLMRAISGFSKEVRLPLIVEGVETADELRVVRGLGVRYAQGFLFRRPGPQLGRSRTYIPRD